MVKARKYVVKKYFEGMPKKEDYDLVEYELPPLKNNEILVKSEFISVDPSLRVTNRMNPAVPYDQLSYQVGIVQQSKNPKFPVGSRVVSYKGWCDYYVADPSQNNSFTITNYEKYYLLPDLKGLPTSLACGAVGMPGVSAYFGFLEICKPKAGETVVVTGTAGAVGSLVGQIAKIKGCRVIGFAGSDEKVEWLEKDLGFDKAFNYKTVDVTAALKEAAPKGIDCYFDNVGGEISSIIINQMNLKGRVTLCGNISMYNDDPTKLPKATVVLPIILRQNLTVQGFHAYEWDDRWMEAVNQMVEWIASGKIKAREHITEGFENLYRAFVGMLAGENIGKAVVKV